LTEFETLLTQSKIEQTLYDFKQGFTKLDGRGDFDQDSFDKIIKTLTAMANHSL
jgi:response regulator of citrate/malate metabolism